MNVVDLFKKLNSNDALSRCDAIEELSENISVIGVADEIQKHFDDNNFLVRSEAYDAFYGYADTTILDKLCYRIKKEKSKCARMHLCSTVCSIIKQVGCSKQLYNVIKQSYTKEKSTNVLLSYWCIFYLVERDKSYIQKILSYLSDEDYHIRCNVINLLADIEDSYVKQCERETFSARLESEDSEAVRVLLKDSLEDG